MTQTFNSFFAMGGYGVFVWSAYGLSAFVLALNVVSALRRERRLLGELSRTSPALTGETR